MDHEVLADHQKTNYGTKARRLLALIGVCALEAIALFCTLLPAYLGVAATLHNEYMAKNALLESLIFALFFPIGQLFLGYVFRNSAERASRNRYEFWLLAKKAKPWKWLVVYLGISITLTGIGLLARANPGNPTLETMLGYSFGWPADVMFCFWLMWFIADKTRTEPQNNNPALPTV